MANDLNTATDSLKEWCIEQMRIYALLFYFVSENIFFLLFFYLWQLYNIFPWMGKWIKPLKLLKNNVEVQVNNFRDLIHQLKTTLNPEMCRCLIDSFLIRKQKDEVCYLCYFEPECDI